MPSTEHIPLFLSLDRFLYWSALYWCHPSTFYWLLLAGLDRPYGPLPTCCTNLWRPISLIIIPPSCITDENPLLAYHWIGESLTLIPSPYEVGQKMLHLREDFCPPMPGLDVFLYIGPVRARYSIRSDLWWQTIFVLSPYSLRQRARCGIQLLPFKTSSPEFMAGCSALPGYSSSWSWLLDPKYWHSLVPYKLSPDNGRLTGQTKVILHIWW